MISKPYIDVLKSNNPDVQKDLKAILFIDKAEKVQKWHNLFKDQLFFPV